MPQQLLTAATRPNWYMARSSAALLLVALCSIAVSPLHAQAPQQSLVDATKLPVNLDRLQQKVKESVAREENTGFTLRYTVDVFAPAPRIQLFQPDDNLRFGAPRFAVPTHQQMMDVVTPQEFRSPVMDFSNLMRWLQIVNKEKK
jgi:hypothetical protein